MDPPVKFPASPGTPLFPLSPERVNGTRPPYNGQLLQSPTMPEFGKASMGTGSVDPFLFNNSGSPTSPFRHSRNNSASDAHVQGMVARFDSLSIRDYKAQNEVAIKRADMAREMAELERDKLKREMRAVEEELRKSKEESRKVKKDVADGSERERKITKRLDVVMEELHRSKETHAHAITIYEKEIRKSRKEAFKSGSTLVKLQEELKATRNSLRITQSGLESEKLKCSKREQEAFTAQYQLVGIQEELQRAHERIKVVEEERDTLKTSLKEEEVARIAAEGRIALPAMGDDDDDDLLSSPRKSPKKVQCEVSADSENKENILPKKAVELRSLQEELAMERRLREKVQEQVEFMKMECQFQCCSCRIAEKQGTRYIYDDSFTTEMERIKSLVPHNSTPPPSDTEDEKMLDALPTKGVAVQDFADKIEVDSEANTEANVDDDADEIELDSGNSAGDDAEEDAQESIDIEEDLDSKARFSTIEPDEVSTESSLAKDDMNTQEPTPASPPQTPAIGVPHTPNHREIRTITTTTTVPIMFSPFPNNSQDVPTTPMTVGHPPLARSPFKPDGTLDREAALAQIRERRGRARSVAMGQATPKKQMVEGVTGRRDISAPALKSAWTKN